MVGCSFACSFIFISDTQILLSCNSYICRMQASIFVLWLALSDVILTYLLGFFAFANIRNYSDIKKRDRFLCPSQVCIRKRIPQLVSIIYNINLKNARLLFICNFLLICYCISIDKYRHLGTA